MNPKPQSLPLSPPPRPTPWVGAHLPRALPLLFVPKRRRKAYSRNIKGGGIEKSLCCPHGVPSVPLPPPAPCSASQTSPTAPQLLRPRSGVTLLSLSPSAPHSHTAARSASPGTSVSRNLLNSAASLHPSGQGSSSMARPGCSGTSALSPLLPPPLVPHRDLGHRNRPPGSPAKALQRLRRVQNKSQTLTTAPKPAGPCGSASCPGGPLPLHWSPGGLPGAQTRQAHATSGPWYLPLPPPGRPFPAEIVTRSLPLTCQVRVLDHLSGGKVLALTRLKSSWISVCIVCCGGMSAHEHTVAPTKHFLND